MNEISKFYTGVIATFPLAKHCRFYNAVGRIDVEALRRILGPFAEVGNFFQSNFSLSLIVNFRKLWATMTSREIWTQPWRRVSLSPRKMSSKGFANIRNC